MSFNTTLNKLYHLARENALDEFVVKMAQAAEHQGNYLDEALDEWIDSEIEYKDGIAICSGRRKYYAAKAKSLILMDREQLEAALNLEKSLEDIKLKVTTMKNHAEQVTSSVWFQGDDRNLPTFN